MRPLVHQGSRTGTAQIALFTSTFIPVELSSSSSLDRRLRPLYGSQERIPTSTSILYSDQPTRRLNMQVAEILSDLTSLRACVCYLSYYHSPPPNLRKTPIQTTTLPYPPSIITTPRYPPPKETPPNRSSGPQRSNGTSERAKGPLCREAQG